MGYMYNPYLRLTVAQLTVARCLEAGIGWGSGEARGVSDCG